MQLSEILSFLETNKVEFDFQGDHNLEIHQVAGLDSAQTGEISFLTDKKYLSFLSQTQASAVILRSGIETDNLPAVIYCDNPYYVYALVAQFLNPYPAVEAGVSKKAIVHEKAAVQPSATVSEGVVVQEGAFIGDHSYIAPGAVIEAHVQIGQGCRIGSNVVISHHCMIGNNTIIEAGSVIGGDGFGWANNQGQWVKIPQVGKVVIGNDVSIGNNVTIDRGAVKDTVIEDNCIIDNQVHIAHNVVIGSGSAIAGQVGFAGSTVLGKNCTVAGQVGFAGHIEITDNCHFLAKAGVTHDIKEAGAYAGFPAIKAADWQKNSVRIRQLEKLAKQVKMLQKEIADLSQS